MFHKIKFNILELNLFLTLNSGQSFRWKPYANNEFIGVFQNQVWILKQDDDFIYFKNYQKTSDHIDENPSVHQLEALIKDYFRMDTDLNSLYAHWNSVDEIFKKRVSKIKGVRILRQDPVENIFSFICSTNNNINRISSLVEKLCSTYGSPIAEIEGQKYYSFPTIKALANEDVEANLKLLGFGYRAKYISTTAQKLLNEYSEEFLNSLRTESYEFCKRILLNLSGIGPKVADCVCLMSLDKLNVVPVDTHVKQVAERDYLLKIKSKSLTDTTYSFISNFFQELWGDYAGWAQSVVFTAELKRKRSFNKD